MGTISSYGAESTVLSRTGFPPATITQKATAALAGWRVVLFYKRAPRGWQTLDPNGTEMNRYECEEDGWAAAWALCEARAEAYAVGQGAEGNSAWWDGWFVFRAQQRSSEGRNPHA